MTYFPVEIFVASFRMTSTHLEELPEQGQPVLLKIDVVNYKTFSILTIL